MAKIKYEIELGYVANGLDKIKENLKNLAPKVSKADQDFILKIQARMDNIIALIPKNGEKISIETHKLITKSYNQLISDVTNKGPKMTGLVSKALDESLEAINTEIGKTQNTLNDFIARKKEINKIISFDENKEASLRPKSQQGLFEKMKSRDKDFKIGAVSLKKDDPQDVKSFLSYTDTINKNIQEAKEKNEEYLLSEREKIALLQRQKFDQEALALTAKEKIKYNETLVNIETTKDLIAKQMLQYESQANAITKEEVGDSEELKQLKQGIKKLIEDSLKLQTEINEKQEEISEEEKKQLDLNDKKGKQAKEQSAGLLAATKNVINYSVVIQGLRRVYRETIKTITELDRAMTDMAIVTEMNREEAWKLIPTMQKLAKETGFTTTEVSALTTEYLKQGKTLNDALILSEAAAKAAKVAGISASESVKYLTAAINGFNLAAKDAMEVSDKFAALAAASATDYEQLAVGLSKFASQANLAGISIDFALGMLAKGVETTQEAPESIGTALKTVLARMRELTDYGKTLEDGMNLNRVETALEQVGIRLRNVNGTFRDMESVLTEVGSVWDTLNTNQQAAVAVAMAGTRQQSRLIAIFNDFDRTLQLVDESQDSAGATAAQHAEYMESMAAAMTRLQTAWQGFITAISSSELVIDIVNTLSKTIEILSSGITKLGIGGQTIMATIIGLVGANVALNAVVKISGSTLFNFTNINQLLIKSLKGVENAEKLSTSALIKKLVIQKIGKENEKIKIRDLLKSIFLTEKETAAIKKNTKAKLVGNMVTTGGAPKAPGIASKASGAASAAGAAPAAGMASSLSAFGWIAIAIVAVVGAVVLFKKGIKDAEEGVDSFASSFYKTFMGIGESIKSLISAVVEALKSLGKLIIGIFKVHPAMIGLKIYLKFFIDNLRMGIQVIRLLAHYIEKLFDGISKAFGGKGIQKILDWFDGATKWYSKLVDNVTKEVDKLTKSQEELNAEVDKFTNKKSVENYELKQTNKSLENLIDSYEKINNKPIKTDEDIESLKALAEELKTLKDGEYFKVDITGEIDWNKSIKALNDAIIKNAATTRDNLAKIMAEAWDKSTTTEVLAKTTAASTMSDFEFQTGQTVSDEAKASYQKYIENLIGQGKTEEYFTSVITGEFMSIFDQASMLISKQNTSASQYGIFTQLMGEYAGNPEALTALREQFKEFAYIFDNFGNLIPEDSEALFNILDKLNLSSDNFIALSNAAKKAKKDINVELETLSNEIIRLTDSGYDAETAFSMAFASLANGTEDATYKAELFKIAMGQSTLNIAQDLDSLTSTMKTFNETQDKFAKGELSQQELFNFINDHPEYFKDPAFVSAFKEGRDLSIFLYDEIIKERERYLTQLSIIRSQLLSDPNNESLLTEENRLEMLLSTSNQLVGLTASQQEYNNVLKEYELLQKLNIKNTEVEQERIELLRITTAQAIAQNQTNISNLTLDYNKKLQAISGYSKTTIDSIFTIENGIVRVASGQEELYSRLSVVAGNMLNNYQDEVQNNLNQITELFMQAAEVEKKTQEEALDKKKKLYEDYFDSLDRLENKRERERSREDIVKQLQRLEGATDERSRQKAKELRAELIQMDQESAKQDREDARKSVLDAIDAEKEALTEYWGEVAENVVNAMAQGGKEAALAYLKGIYGENSAEYSTAQASLSESTYTPDINTINTGTIKTKDILPFQEAEEYNNLKEQLLQKLYKNNNIIFRKEQAQEIFDQLYITGNKNILDFLKAMAEGRVLGTFYRAAEVKDYDDWLSRGWGFRKGGLVDYTGPAMVHGSSSSPEAFLNANQTALFANLRDALVNLSVNKDSSSIQIDNITIQTQSLNNNLDFKTAGQTLAEAFSSAITRRGLNLNTRR